MRSPESWVKFDVDKYLDGIGAYVVKQTTFGMGGSGHSDRIVCFAGKFISIEVKREGKTPTPIQERRMKEVRAAGGIAIWGDNAKDIIEQFKQALGLQ